MGNAGMHIPRGTALWLQVETGEWRKGRVGERVKGEKETQSYISPFSALLFFRVSYD